MTLHQHRQSGLSLIELMIAMVLGLILIGGVIAIFLSSKQSYRLTEGISQVQERGRFAIHFITHDVREAGYMGCNAELGPNYISNVLKVDETNTKEDFIYTFQQSIQGFDDVTSTPPELGTLAHEPIIGTDIITVRTAVDGGLDITATMPVTSNNLKVSSTDGLQEGDIVMLSDCLSGVIFQITKVMPESNHIKHKKNTGSPGNSVTDLGKKFGAGANVIKLATISYFIAPRDEDDTDCAAGTCGLWEKVGGDNAQQLVPDVEDMQVKYGVDKTGDKIPDVYADADTVEANNNWKSVVTVRVALLVASDGSALSRMPTSKFSRKVFGDTITMAAPEKDMKLRRVFIRTITLRNRM